VRAVLLFLLAATLLLGETFKLYLKDGDYHVVREYQVQGDRVRYYSTERGEWEEIPVALVDLDKTEQQRKARQQAQQEETRQQDEEDQAIRELQREIASIPMDPGGYYKQNGQIKALKMADYQVITDKKRHAIQILSPVPLIPGKASVVIKGSHSDFVVNEPRPNFYMRLAKEERFGIIRLTPKKDARLVENIAIVPVSKQALEERKQMDTFEQQLGNGLFKIWPEKPLEPGEYALVQFADTEDQQDIELLVWDFAVR
jgi:ATPase subunit of ABC transporter with duplicated ATPase domains